jgi:hypothetical protein
MPGWIAFGVKARGELAIASRDRYCTFDQYHLATPMLQIPLTPAPKLYLPLFADRVQAGFPSPAQGYEQKAIDLKVNSPATYFVRAVVV